MSKKELEDKLKRKNLQIESQIALLDEYRNTIKFLEAKIFRMEQELSKLHQPTVISSVCEHEWKADQFDCYGNATRMYCDNCDAEQTDL